MWIVIILLASVPMFFYWSGSVADVFPALAQYFPHKTSPTGVPASEGVQYDDSFVPSRDTLWAQEDTKAGYAAWVISLDGGMRMGIGCRQGQKPAMKLIQLIRTDAGLKTIELADSGLTLNYKFGVLPLTSGYYQADDLVSAVGQFSDLYLQDSDGLKAYAQFTVDPIISGAIGQHLASRCAR